ncbi:MULTISPECIES: acyl-CoA thioesterase [unclassified Motilimonas]|uniref:acyl-CoA thioesterase n=1 Tax=Motilimonas TaxID=1914248 RepID=UPI001E3F58B8|nr:MULTISPECIES: acyl-CoA thioesterase [unclassified Motilimonas]MCE0559034.1 acyl-CoA thioesterase [Motilimonas sp. E26]MDO6527008.1 acyl-CoA thioesterase [Motilimonas sp. 1_MG-2023]
MSQPFRLPFKVRDYECDMQGIVNNGVYFNYLEHARHEFLLQQGVNFAELTQEGIHLVVVKAELDYKTSLTSGDEFYIQVEPERPSKVRFAFRQTVVRLSDNKTVLTALITGTSLNKSGRPYIHPKVDCIFPRS